MAAPAEKASHLERTVAEPRERSLHPVVLRRVDQINDQIRLFRLEVSKEGPVIRFLPGQWLDVFVPGVPKAGGFTITSAPSKARWGPAPSTPEGGAEPGYLELAVQKSPDNPPAAWLWRDEGDVLGAELRVRVGGSFVWPPPGINARASLRRAVFVAGGVGVNPLMSMLSALAGKPDAVSPSFEAEFLYSVRDPGPRNRRADRILFLDRIAAVFAEGRLRGRLRLFLTGAGEEEGTIPLLPEKGGGGSEEDEEDEREKRDVPFCGRRMTVDDLAAAVGRDPADRRFAVVYVCGVPAMTDEFVRELTDPKGKVAMEPYRVLCEKWW